MALGSWPFAWVWRRSLQGKALLVVRPAAGLRPTIHGNLLVGRVQANSFHSLAELNIRSDYFPLFYLPRLVRPGSVILIKYGLAASSKKVKQIARE